MKRYLYILLFIVLATSCMREALGPETGSPVEDKTKGLTVPVVMHFSEPITLYAQTKATAGMEWGVDPRISSIHVAVFGWGGYLQDYIKAEPCDASGNPISGYADANAATDADATNYFLVRLPINTDGRRTCHIIANGPESVEFAYDTDLMKELSTTDGNGGYWQWVYLADGILPERDAAGEFVTDVAGELKPSDAVKTAFSNISLIRNFASVTVSVADGCNNFVITGWTICQMPLDGCFVPYSSDWEASNVIDGRGYGWLGDYATGWTYNSSTAKVTKDAITYEGFPLSPRIDKKTPQTPSAFNAAGVAVASGATKYFYERAVTADTNPFLLIEAKYVPEDPDPAYDYATALASADTYYYRMDIAKDGEYVPFYRNYSYKITISGASVEGYSTPALAAKHNSSDSFSLSLDTATLSDVSDGLTRLTTEKAAFSYTYDSGAASKSFEYDFVQIEGDAHLNTKANVTVTVTGDAIKSTPALDWGASGSKGVITYTLAEPDGDEVLTSTIKIMGVIKDGSSNVISRLVRTVTVVVFNKMHVTPKFVPQIVSKRIGEETTLIIPLYKDLPWTLFPLRIKIEDMNKTLNPSAGSNIPVEVGPFKEGEPSTFYYVYTLNYSDYEEMNEDAKASGKSEVEISVPMTTILDENATTARVWNDYFALKDYTPDPADAPKASLLNDNDNIITPNTATVAASATSYTFTVKSTGNWILTVSREHGAAATGTSISRSSGTAGTFTDVTVSFPANTTLVERKYILTLTNTDKAEDKTRTAELTQAAATPFLTPTSAITSVKGNDLTTEVTINVSSNSDWEAAITTGYEYAEFTTENVGSRDGSVNIRMTTNNYGTNGATGRSVVVTFTNLSSGATTTHTITQRGLYTSSTFDSNSLTGNGQTLSISNTSNGCTISFVGSGTSSHDGGALGFYQHYYIGSGNFTASGSGTDFCSFKELTLNTYYGGLTRHFPISSMTNNPNIGNKSYGNESSTWTMVTPITSSNAVKTMVLTPTGSGWHVVGLGASYYYWE